MQCPPRSTLMYSHTKSLMRKKKKKKAPTGAVVQELFCCPVVKVRCSCNASGQQDENICVSALQCTSNAFCLTAGERKKQNWNWKLSLYLHAFAQVPVFLISCVFDIQDLFFFVICSFFHTTDCYWHISFSTPCFCSTLQSSFKIYVITTQKFTHENINANHLKKFAFRLNLFIITHVWFRQIQTKTTHFLCKENNN